MSKTAEDCFPRLVFKRWPLTIRKVFLAHGEDRAREPLAAAIEQRF